MSNEVFAQRLRTAMEKHQMKQVDLVRAAQEQGMKLGKSHVSQYVSGKTVPRTEILNFLAAALQVEPDWLMGKETVTENGSLKEAASESADLEDGSMEREDNIRVFRKSTKLDHVLYDVRGPVVEEAERMEQAGVRILKLNIGNPAPFDFHTPDEVIHDMQQQLTRCEGYSPANGLFAARKAIMQYAQLKNIPNVSVDDIYTGNGVSELINLCMSALLNDGDEILIPSPDYPLWTACATLAGGKAVHYICDEQSDWYPDMADIRKKITSRTKAIVIINPNNPTGALYPREVLQQIVDIAREHQLMIFSDEIYDRLVMDGEEHVSIASACAGSVLRDLQRTVQIAYGRGIPDRMDDSQRKQTDRCRLYRGNQDAFQYETLLQCTGAVDRTDGTGRASERQGLHCSRRKDL